MNSKWFYRAVGAAGLAGGALLLGAGVAHAGVAQDGAVPQHPIHGVMRPIMVDRDGAGATGSHRLGYYPEADLLPGVSSAPGSTPTNGTRVDTPKVTDAVGNLLGKQAKSVTNGGGNQGLLGRPEDAGIPVVSSLAGPGKLGQLPLGQLPLTNGGQSDQSGAQGDDPEHTVTALPLSDASSLLPVDAPEAGGFTVGQGNQLPTDGLLGKLDQVGAGLSGPVSGAQAPSQPEAAPLPIVDNLADGTNVAGLPMNVTTPVTHQLAGQAGKVSPEGDDPSSDGSQDGDAPSTGSDPLSAVGGLLGGGLA